MTSSTSPSALSRSAPIGSRSRCASLSYIAADDLTRSSRSCTEGIAHRDRGPDRALRDSAEGSVEEVIGTRSGSSVPRDGAGIGPPPSRYAHTPLGFYALGGFGLFSSYAPVARSGPLLSSWEWRPTCVVSAGPRRWAAVGNGSERGHADSDPLRRPRNRTTRGAAPTGPDEHERVTG